MRLRAEGHHTPSPRSIHPRQRMDLRIARLEELRVLLMAELFRQFGHALVQIDAQLRRGDLAVAVCVGEAADAVDEGLGEGPWP